MKKVTVQLVDDLDGTVIEEGHGRTVSFALDGEGFEIDLTEVNRRKLRAVLDPYIAAAHKTTSTRARRRKALDPTRTSDLQAIREWAASEGIAVGDRGRIATTVREAYDRAH